jgi:hypothetical protein
LSDALWTLSTWLLNLFVVGGPAVLVAWGLIQWLGPKLVDQALTMRLEKFKSEQQQELEKLRHLLSSRISKIHEKEFEVLPQAWLMLNDLHGSVALALGATIKWYPDFHNLNDLQFEELLSVKPASRLSDSQKDTLRRLQDPRERQKFFGDAMAVCDMDEALDKRRLFQNFLIEHRIFMNDELREKFGAVSEALSHALTGFEYGDAKMKNSALEEVGLLREKVDAVEQAIQKRLRYEEA